MSEPGIQTANVDPAEFARSVASTPDEQLAEGMRSELRGQILDEIFRRMEEHFDADKAAGIDAVIHWRITDRADGGADEYEIVIRNGACKATNSATEAARVTFTTGAVQFLKLVTGNVSGPELFMQGGLKVEGDLVFAAQIAGLFKVPQGA